MDDDRRPVARLPLFAASGFEIGRSHGILVTVTIGFALLTEFPLLSPLPMAIDRRKT